MAQKCQWVMKRDCELLFFFTKRVFQALQSESKTQAVSPTRRSSYSLTLVLQVYFVRLLNCPMCYADATLPCEIAWNT